MSRTIPNNNEAPQWTIGDESFDIEEGGEEEKEENNLHKPIRSKDKLQLAPAMEPDVPEQASMSVVCKGLTQPIHDSPAVQYTTSRPGAVQIRGPRLFSRSRPDVERGANETSMTPIEAEVVQPPDLVVATPAPTQPEMVNWWDKTRNRKLLIAVSLLLTIGVAVLVTALVVSSGDGGGGGDSPATPVPSFVPTLPGHWEQIGQDLTGEAAGDLFGWSVSLSGQGTSVAIGGRKNGGNGTNSGHVRVYQINGDEWVQVGGDIDGEAEGDGSGWSVSLSADGTTVAIGAIDNDAKGPATGQVRVYRLVEGGGRWVQVGTDLDGEEANDEFGTCVSLSADGTTVAVGAPYHGVNDTESGHVRIFQLDGEEFVQLGSDLEGDAAEHQFGTSVSLSADGKMIAIGAKYKEIDSKAGYVRIYGMEGGSWTKIGSDLHGEQGDDYFGNIVALSDDAGTVAVGAYHNNGNGDNAGHARVYRLSEGDWVQVGLDIDGEAANDESGGSISLSEDGTTIAVGASLNDGTGDSSGHVRIYQLDESQWIQVGSDLDGKGVNDKFGFSISLSADGKSVAAGAPYNNGNGSDSGHVRVYCLVDQ